jgi:hypothetical protein
MNNTTIDTNPSGAAVRGGRDRQGNAVLAKRTVEEDEPMTLAVIACAKQAGVYPDDPDRLLNDVVDPDALERIFADTLSGTPRQGGRVAFEVWGHTFVVSPDEVVVLE